MPRRPRKTVRVFKKGRNVCKPLFRKENESPSGNNISSPRPIPVSNRTVLSELESASNKKLGNLDDKYDVYNKEENVNIIIDLGLLSSALCKFLKCSSCDSTNYVLRNPLNVGLASQLELYCMDCMKSHSFMSSGKIDLPKTNQYEINTRMVYGLRSIGKGTSAAKTLCGILNLPAPPTKFMAYVEILGSSAEDVCFKGMKEAVEQAVDLNDGVRDIPVAIDGTWQKRGYTSLNGVITATSFDSGLVIDLAIFSKHCICPNKLSGAHELTCIANYKGASGGMEVEGARQIFSRSVGSYNVRYTRYLGDGDSKGFGAVEEMCPYGPDCKIKKLECIGHIQKRMGTRLRRLKAENKSVKLSDGKGLGGKNRLSSTVIDQLQSYYGQAIRKNSHSVQDMKRSIWALYYHKVSTDEDPNHGLCPAGTDSWCKFNKSIATGEHYTHRSSIPKPIMEFIKPVFKSLSDPTLLERCLHGHTQNPNESVNHVIWSRLPKTGFVGLKTLHFGVYDAVATFNSGQITKCQVLAKCGISVGKNTVAAMKLADKCRLFDSLRAASEISKQARQKKRSSKRKLEDKEEDPDDPSYGAGLF